MLTISREADYALLLISQLKKNKELTPLSVMIKNTRLPKRFLARIASKLAKAKLLKSREGKIGGYSLNVNWQKTNLFDFLLIFEKHLDIVKCSKSHYQCNFKSICSHSQSLRNKIHTGFVNSLKSMTLQEIFEKGQLNS